MRTRRARMPIRPFDIRSDLLLVWSDQWTL